MNDMTGHNSGTAAHHLNAAIAGLGLALQDARTTQRTVKESMIVVARHLLAVDQATAGNEALSDAEIKRARIVAQTDLIASEAERSLARWLARGGVGFNMKIPKNANEINDLSGGALNPVEARFLTAGKFTKLTTYQSLNQAFARECKAEIRAALDGSADAPTLDTIRSKYAGALFKAETIDGWVAEENYRRSPEYARVQELKKAWALRVEEAIEEAKKDDQALSRLEAQVKKQLAKIREEKAKLIADREAQESANKLTAHQRRVLLDDLRSRDESTSQEATDADF